jgi:hypothetical protein
MAVGIKKFNWVKRPTSWESIQTWRSKHNESVQQFMNQSAAASTAFTNAQNSLTTGMANLAAEASLQRVQSRVNTALNSLNLLA